jgi:2-dehydro-3-deoxygalactonokinase
MSTLASPFIAVDWSASILRAALIAPDGEILDELVDPRGVLTLQKGEFASYLLAACARFTSAGGRLFLLAGFVGSARGMAEVQHVPCPAGPAELAAGMLWAVPERVALVPGVRSDYDDVMRGQELQVLGAAAGLGVQDALMVLPGTHSKWVSLEAGQIVGFNTFMTGEFQQLLAQHSRLALHLPPASAAPTPLDHAAFLEGIDYATNSESLLNTAFNVQVRSLFKQLTPEQAASYLWGLVIGEELVSMQLEPGLEVVLIGTPIMCERYKLALEHLEILVHQMGTQTSWAGLHKVYQALVVR